MGRQAIFRRSAIGAVYFDVPYDKAAYYGTAGKLIDTKAYTLPNLVQYGGVCTDQAFFATAVARSLGVPATVCTGQAEQDSAHAWVGFLEQQGKRVRWNFQEGRYPEMNFWRGDVQDPQTRQRVTDSDVSLLAELAMTKPADRLASIALCKSHDLFPAEKQAGLYTKAINMSPGNRDAWEALADLGARRKLLAGRDDQRNRGRRAIRGQAISRFCL